MPIRRQRGHLTVVTSPQAASQGRRQPIAHAKHLPPSTSQEALLLGIVAAQAEALLLAEGQDLEAAQRARRRARDLRHRASKKLGRPLVAAWLALASTLGRSAFRVLGATTTATEVREAFLAALASGVRTAQERRIETADGLRALARSVVWTGLFDLGTARALGADPDALKSLGSLGQHARLDALAAAQLGTTRSEDDDAASAVLERLRRMHDDQPTEPATEQPDEEPHAKPST